MNKTYIRDGRAPIPENEITSKVMSSIHAKHTRPELALRQALSNNGLAGYRLHWKKAPGRPDVAYPKIKLAIFINGCYWHRCPYCNPPLPKTHQEFWIDKFSKNVERDQRKIRELEAQAWRVLVFWECQIKDKLDDCIERVRLARSQGTIQSK
jgi:DNA mismatch endonuclease, patch repair protein